MRKSSCGHVIGVPVTSKAYALEEATTRGAGAAKKDGDRLAVSLTHPSPYASFGYKHSSKGQVIHWVNKLGRRAQGFRDHVTLGPKLSETVKGKLSLGARILQAGGVERAAAGQLEEPEAPSRRVVQQLAAPSQLVKEWRVAPGRHAVDHSGTCIVDDVMSHHSFCACDRTICCRCVHDRSLSVEVGDAASSTPAPVEVVEEK
ncbi:unnamed protein product [Triticum turgidum subsp. durum]|uniref:Uncharacterized protein n=1 Tax=Triticum turgidum subsp. durum TaxID=4567 RepID=A0A9R0Y2R5_TRITD|nr:unnamed protein product [Triticum turgidum subsp. durum]